MLTSSTLHLPGQESLDHEGDELEDEMDDDVPWRSPSEKIAWVWSLHGHCSSHIVFHPRSQRIEGTWWSPYISLIYPREQRGSWRSGRRYKARYKFIDTLVRWESWFPFFDQSLFDLCTGARSWEVLIRVKQSCTSISCTCMVFFLSCVNYLYPYIYIYIYLFPQISGECIIYSFFFFSFFTLLILYIISFLF